MSGLDQLGPLCDRGRCAQILAALAEGDTVQRIRDRQADYLAWVLRGTLAELGMSVGDDQVSAALTNQIRRLLAGEFDGSTVGRC